MSFTNETTIVAFKKYALFVVSASLIPVTNAISFHYRFYDNNACDHNSPSQDTFPLNGRGPLLGSQDQCLSAPQSSNWTTLEVANASNVITGGLRLMTFCNINCEGAGSSEQNRTNCFIAAPNCFIGSFSVTQTASGVGNTSSTQPSNTSIPSPSTGTVTQVPIGIGSSSPTQSFNTSKSKISTGTVIGGVIGGVVVIAGLIFIPFFLLQRAKKRRLVSPFDIPELATPVIPSPGATTIDEGHPMSLTPIRGQATGKFIGADHSSGAPIIVSSDREHIPPLYNGPDRSQFHRQEGSAVRFSESEGSMVQLPPLYSIS
ncbi:hypothetical protein GALMADRAFT_138719 [Galerina marginata CBS 339.88]|uniref:Uncharacterized protein n=1 Tax=Galerina marginata (strain CBS 339.88) TaxID=685588 RepID=A0A067TCL7_GALM3|nr:hypothetical protein GALMADRAFT_138719 [Galerina marginata CBS 339.88]